ncbi:MAG: enoyl-CoA hydratase/isomerase family protein, partial [Deltaproteobacteria bacterium]|nr:enoyl-CoA hydratase/isomerase family protein [Deltaproteobacteria bacterium]
MVRFERRGNVFVLRLDAGENRFTPAVLHALREGLEQVESAGSPAALVTTGTGKFYSNGLDLDHMGSLGSGGASDYLTEVLAVLARILTFPATTVAAVNGHAFGAGALMAIAHDFQVMRADRGFFCMPEVDMRVPLHPGMTALLQARLPVRTVHRVIATGKRFGGEEAVAAGIVD